MIKVNLLPWRDEIKRQRLKIYIKIISFILLIAISATFCFLLKTIKQIQQFEQKNNLLAAQIKILTPRCVKLRELLKKEALLKEKITEIKHLQKKQLIHLLFFTELSKNIPDAVILNRIKYLDNNIEFTGSARSYHDLTAFSNRLENSNYLSEPKILEIKKNSDKDAIKKNEIDFRMNAKLINNE